MTAKTKAQRNARLLALAKGRHCMLRVPNVCRDEVDTVVACHGNSSAYGKAIGRKADDHYSVWGCARCHTWLDSSYCTSGKERQKYFQQALSRQLIAWGAIARNDGEKARDQAAALWALDLHGAV